MTLRVIELFPYHFISVSRDICKWSYLWKKVLIELFTLGLVSIYLTGVKGKVERKEGTTEKMLCFCGIFKSMFYELKLRKTIMMSKYLKRNIMLHRGHSGTDVGVFHVCP